MSLSGFGSIYVLALCVVCSLFFVAITIVLNFLRSPLNGADCHAHFAVAAKVVNVIGFAGLMFSVFFGDTGSLLVADLIFGMVLINNVCFFLWHLFLLSDVSMHIHVLVEIYRHNRISPDELGRHYDKDAIVRARIPRLIAIGQLRCHDGMLQVSGGAVLRRARVMALVRAIFGLPKRPVLTDFSTIKHSQ